MKSSSAEDLLTQARAATAASVETVFVPEWDREVVIRAVDASTLWRKQSQEARAEGDQDVLRTINAEWLMAGIVEPQLSLGEASELLKTHAAPVTRLLELIRMKSQVGISAEEWALRTLELQSPETHVLAEFYRQARQNGQDPREAVREALLHAEGETSLTWAEILGRAQQAAAEGWQEAVEAEKKASLPTPSTDSASGKPA